MNNRPASFLLYSAFLANVFFFGSSWMFNKMVLQEGASPLWAAAIRQSIAAIILLIVFLIKRPSLKDIKRHLKLIILYGIMMMTFGHLFAFMGQQYLYSGLSSIIFSFFPLAIMIISLIIIPGKEPITIQKASGAILGFLGIIFIFYSRDLLRDQDHFILGITFILLSVFVNAIPNVIIKRDGAELNPILLNTGGMLIGASLLLGTAFTIEGLPGFDFTPKMIGAFFYLGVFCSALTFLLYFWLLRHIPVFNLSLSAYLTPLVAIILGYLFYDEILSVNHYIGMFLIFTGIFITQIRRYAKHRNDHI